MANRMSSYLPNLRRPNSARAPQAITTTIHIARDCVLVNGIVTGRRSVTAETALLLARELKTSPECWLNAQMAVDGWRAQAELEDERPPRRESA